ncbi:MAG: PEP-CTERM-box response regulator transcription factor [Gammaproteobacteria bacterium]|nr:PEP-CTERM-box response regulator transcription factor [Gammaproteobacteria bacterium]
MSDNRKPLLMIEDDPGLQSQLRWSFEHYEVHIAGDKDSAIGLLRRHEPAVITLDLGLPPDPTNASEGLATLRTILQLAPRTKVIVVTGNDERENAIKAVAMGAYDFYQKPIDPEVLSLIIDRAYRLRELEDDNRRLQTQSGSSPLAGIIATSPEMLKVCRMVEKVAPADVTTLLHGESGTGKEVLARALHALSPRRDNRLVAINCAAIPDTLLESELFGYEKGAFTGAVKQTKGKIECADGGTLFLDEIGDLPMPLQAKLLRFLQQRVIERIGGREEIPVDVRVVCATHRNLTEMVAEGTFREDLYYRLSEITVEIPPLRARRGDVPLLARRFLEQYNQALGRNLKGFSPEALSALEAHQWPGNVRELENRLKRAVVMAETSLLGAEDLQLDGAAAEPAMPLNLRQVREQAEGQAILRALQYTEGNISRTAELLGVTRPTLYALMNKYHLQASID